MAGEGRYTITSEPFLFTPGDGAHLELYTVVKNAQGSYDIPENKLRQGRGPFKVSLVYYVLEDAGDDYPFFTANIQEWCSPSKALLHFNGEDGTVHENTIVLWNDRSKAYSVSGKSYVHAPASGVAEGVMRVMGERKKFVLEITNAPSSQTPSRIDLCFRVSPF